MSQYKVYPAYKDSGVEWIGQVPEHWTIAPVKYHYDARLGKMIQPAAVSDRDIEVPYHRAQTVQWERIVESDIKEMWASPRDIEQFSVSEGDLLICEGGDVCRAAIVKQPPEKNMIFQNSIHRIRSKGEYGVGWVMRLMQHLRSSEWIDVLCNKNTIVHFTSDKLGSLECPLPPPDEQASIAAALDRETARIDALIEKKTRFIELMKEKRQALITHAVTKGLDPNVKMKDSGVEWIGQVPKHWQIAQLKRLVSIQNGSDHKAIETDDGYPVYGSGGKFAYASSYIYDGESVLLGRKGTIDRPMYVNEKFWTVDTMYWTKILPNTDGKFCYYAATTIPFSYYATNTALPSMTQSSLGAHLMAYPPLKEQAAISATLDRETARIDALIGKVEHSITLLKERRAAFITAAVTGQIDLRGKQ